MIVRKRAESEGSRYQVIYRRTSYPILQNVHIAILSTIYRAIRKRRARQKRNTDRHRPPLSNYLPNPLTPSPLPRRPGHTSEYRTTTADYWTTTVRSGRVSRLLDLRTATIRAGRTSSCLYPRMTTARLQHDYYSRLQDDYSTVRACFEPPGPTNDYDTGRTYFEPPVPTGRLQHDYRTTGQLQHDYSTTTGRLQDDHYRLQDDDSTVRTCPRPPSHI